MNAAEFHQARKFADTTFGRIAYVDKGAGPAALFVHGFPVNGFAWRGTLDDLAGQRRSIALDLMGLGYTEVGDGQDLGFDKQAAMIAAFMDRLGLSQIDLVGNDSGASISQVFAAKYPSRLRSLTITNCEVHDLWPNAMLKAVFDQFADPSIVMGMKTMLDAPAVARQAFASVYEDAERIPDEAFKTYFEPILSSDARSAAMRRFLSLGNLKVLTSIAPQLRELKVPTLVAWGEADSAFDLKSVDWLRHNIGAVRRVIIVPGAKLFFPEEHPKLMSVLLQEFWRSLS
ncbi:MAG: alpha/beta fold hydrolase [Candidatus Binatus sp.]